MACAWLPLAIAQAADKTSGLDSIDMTEAESLSALNRPDGSSCHEPSLSVYYVRDAPDGSRYRRSMTQFRPQSRLARTERHNA
jgi:hypothetical protein